MNWFAASLIIVGYILVVWKKPAGFIFQMMGCGMYIGLFITVDYSIVFINSMFLIINLIGYIKWSKPDES